MAEDPIGSVVARHYGSWTLIETIEQALRANGIEPEQATVEQLAPIDHFHSFGVAGTRELIRLLGAQAGDHVLDIGGGIGGPARLLASQSGCQVTVLDLTPQFCAAGETVTGWAKLSDRVSFVVGSALEMPFADASFDAAWTIHAAMNIADKPRLYAEAHRVLRPGGRFALFDTMLGPNGPLHFPLPWATDPSHSFLLPPDEVRALITQAGFVERAWREGPELAGVLQAASAGSQPPSADPDRLVPLGTALLMGPDAATRIGNAMRDTREGRTVLGMGVFERV